MDDCWEWLGHRDERGYGRLRTKDGLQRVHRVAWESTRGPIPVGAVICHRCDNPGCFNPEHLFVGTQRDNVLDCERKGRGRHPAGEAHGKAKLSADDVAQIKRATSGATELARLFNGSRQQIYRIVSGRQRKSA